MMETCWCGAVGKKERRELIDANGNTITHVCDECEGSVHRSYRPKSIRAYPLDYGWLEEQSMVDGCDEESMFLDFWDHVHGDRGGESVVAEEIVMAMTGNLDVDLIGSGLDQ